VLWEEKLAREYERRVFTMAAAESCTGGLVAHRITNVAGASRYFLGGLITYTNEAKINLLKVEAKLLEEYGAVSAETARAMARGVKRVCGTDLGLGVTGLAGPGGGTPASPVGLVYWAVTFKDKTWVEHEIFSGNREEIKTGAATAVLKTAVEILRSS